MRVVIPQWVEAISHAIGDNEKDCQVKSGENIPILLAVTVLKVKEEVGQEWITELSNRPYREPWR
jgi:hypothetical protein